MSATNSTPTIGLPLFIGTDKPAWLVDFNGAMNTIDSAIANLQTAETGTAGALASLSQSVEALSGTVSQHTTALTTQSQAIAGNTGNINTINSLIGNGQPTTEDKTIIGAINEIYSDIHGGGQTAIEAVNVDFDNTGTGLSASNVQAAITEVKGLIPSIPAATSEQKRGTLAAGQTSLSLTFTDNIDANDLVDIYTPFGVNPTNVTTSGKVLTMTFGAQAGNINVAAVVTKGV